MKPAEIIAQNIFEFIKKKGSSKKQSVGSEKTIKQVKTYKALHNPDE